MKLLIPITVLSLTGNKPVAAQCEHVFSVVSVSFTLNTYRSFLAFGCHFLLAFDFVDELKFQWVMLIYALMFSDVLVNFEWFLRSSLFVNFEQNNKSNHCDEIQ